MKLNLISCTVCFRIQIDSQNKWIQNNSDSNLARIDMRWKCVYKSSFGHLDLSVNTFFLYYFSFDPLPITIQWLTTRQPDDSIFTMLKKNPTTVRSAVSGFVCVFFLFLNMQLRTSPFQRYNLQNFSLFSMITHRSVRIDCLFRNFVESTV